MSTSWLATLLVGVGLSLLSCTGAEDPARHERVQAPLAVAWQWDEREGSTAQLRLLITPRLAAASVTVEVHGPDFVTLEPAAVRTFSQVAAGATLAHEVRCAGLDLLEGADTLDVLVSSSVEGLAMGRSVKIPLPGSSADGVSLPPASGEFTVDEQGQDLRVLPAVQKTTDR